MESRFYLPGYSTPSNSEHGEAAGSDENIYFRGSGETATPENFSFEGYEDILAQIASSMDVDQIMDIAGGMLDKVSDPADLINEEFLDHINELSELFPSGTERKAFEFDYSAPAKVPKLKGGLNTASKKRPDMEEHLNIVADGSFTLSSAEGGEIELVMQDGKSYCVGKILNEGLNAFKIEVIEQDLIKKCGNYSERVGPKGSCLGFSSFVHLMAIVAIMEEGDIHEPIEGFDLRKGSVSIEVTGRNWRKRAERCSADIILNKYPIVRASCTKSEELEFILLASEKEDTKDPSAFDGGGLDQIRGPYCEVFEELSILVSSVTEKQRVQLANQFCSWLSRQKPLTEPEKVTVPDSALLRERLMECSKHGKFPCPFKVLPCKRPDDMEYERNLTIGPRNTALGKRTTFRTLTFEDDPDEFMFGEASQTVKVPYDTFDTPMQSIMARLLTHKIYQYVYTMSELCGKVVGSAGQFFSEYTNVGIAWRRLRSSSPIYLLCFWGDCSDYSDKEIGEWEDIGRGMKRSPSFKASISDIEFSKVLPYRFLSSVTSIMSYTKDKERPSVIRAMLKQLMTLISSSWETSALAKDCRFLTLCSLSKSGDVKKMVDDMSEKLNPERPVSFSNYYYLRLVIKMCDEYNFNDPKETPILRLPVRLCALEKDWSMLFMWHIREANHRQDCLKKLLKGIVAEEKAREWRLNYYKEQNEYLKEMISAGKSQTDFDGWMDKDIENPIFNAVLFMGLAQRAAEHLKQQVGKNQMATEIKLSKMITDKRMVRLRGTKVFKPGAILENCFVADGILDVIKENGNPSSIHELLAKQHLGSRIDLVYGIHPKDARCSNREIPQINSGWRSAQYTAEMLVSGYTYQEESDMMDNPEKYNVFVSTFSKILSNNGKSRSEDKTFFCGNMHLAGMSIGTQVIAMVTGSTYLITASALQRINRRRWTIFPAETELPAEYKELETSTAGRCEMGKIKHAHAVLNHIHMMQGQYAQGAALINTAFSVGMDVCQRSLMEDLNDSFVVTSSDDSARVCSVRKTSRYKYDTVANEYLNRPIGLYKHAMMVDNIRKPINSSKLAEFNNVVTGPNGMFQHGFVHSHLSVQPLRGENLMDDIVTAVSNARSTITWGDSIDVARSSLYGQVILLMQKWLISQEQLDQLVDCSFIPRNDEELVAGFAIRSQETASALWSMMTEEGKESVMKGDKKFVSILRKYNLKGDKQARKRKKISYSGSNIEIAERFDMIERSRKLKGKISGKYLRTKPPDVRMKVTRKFMDSLREEYKRMDDELFKEIVEVHNPPKISIHPLRPKRYYSKPLEQGQIVNNEEPMDMKIILAKREFNTTYRRRPTQSEDEVIKMSPDDFAKWRAKQKMVRKYQGFKFKSPSGLPLMKFHNNGVFDKPKCFSYRVLLEQKTVEKPNLTLCGFEMDNFEPCFWGGASLKKCKEKKLIPAIGFCRKAESVLIVVNRLEKRPEVHEIPRTECEGRNQIEFRIKSKKYLCNLAKDKSYIDPSRFDVIEELWPLTFLSGANEVHKNYGNRYNTSTAGAHRSMSEIFRSLGATLPNFVRRYKPRWPWFPDNSVAIRSCRYNRLLGIKHITRLRLVETEDPGPFQIIDINNGIEVIGQDTDEEEAMW